MLIDLSLAILGAFEGSAYSNTQQDVTEFTSKLLEWVEESLQIYNSALEQSSQLNSIEKEDQSTTSLFSDNSAEEMVSPDQLKGIFYGEIETHGLTDRNEEFQAKEAFIQVIQPNITITEDLKMLAINMFCPLMSR